jgi:DNA recombination protein RmuC
MDAHISASECVDPVQVAIFQAKHAELVKQKIDELAKIDYATVLEKKGKNVADMVVCFIPGEAFFAAAISQDPTLLEYAARKRVFLASPTILITLLRAIALGWRDHELSANAEQISRLGKELYSRLGTMKSHFDNLGSSVRSSVEYYNKMVASLNTRVFPQARQFRELKSVEAGAREVGEGTFVEVEVHPTDGSDWEQPMLIAANAEDQESLS